MQHSKHIWQHFTSTTRRHISLNIKQQQLLRLATHTSAGNLNNASNVFTHLVPPQISHEHCEVFVAANELILQTSLVTGLARVINMYTLLQQQYGGLKEWNGMMNHYYEAFCTRHKLDVKAASSDVTGMHCFEQIYGERAGNKLRHLLQQMHPTLDALMLDSYAKVMNRFVLPYEQCPLLNLRMRELTNVATLAGFSVAPQVISHMRGGMFCIE